MEDIIFHTDLVFCNCHVVVFLETSVLQEVGMLCYVRYLHNNIALLVIPGFYFLNFLTNFIFENVLLHSFILFEYSTFFL